MRDHEDYRPGRPNAKRESSAPISDRSASDLAPREFHVSREARDRYQFDQALITTTGNVVFPGYRAAQLFAQRMNERRDLARHPESAVSAGQLNAMGLLDEILHAIVRAYREQRNPEAFAGAAAWLQGAVGMNAVDSALYRFVEEFPPLAVYRGELSAADYIQGSTAGVENRRILLEELVMLWLLNANPALAPFSELFDDSQLALGTEYPRVIDQLRTFFAGQPPFGPDNQSLIDLLRAPAIASPDSLAGQLRFVLERWRDLVADVLVTYRGRLDPLLTEIGRSMDVLAEETRPLFLGPGPSEVPTFGGPSRPGFDPWSAPERYTPDRDWMPELVLIAKNTYVWLDQLSRKYGRSITKLDEIPDEELDLLAAWGFTGLWFIGIWERSKASARIKQMTGNPEAIASAYSVDDYVIAEALGGTTALDSLRERAQKRGIRLASDMVPNHTAIDSRWVIEHPDWFVSVDDSPFPSYSFGGPDLSSEERVGIFLEDHYYDRTDAAVAFKRTDRWTGSEKYVYHGNDGTLYPWLDTAQLDYLNPEVREAVIQTILHVARQFPVVRFDAAMVLTKLHYHRLWYPEPGAGGDIPSRAQHGLSKEEFDRLMPEEFWREVVDRAAVEAPDTLLLAEAFWLLEGYFVRTLGMHRVYNSAFMMMLRDEENAQYRQVLKNTLEYDPEILWRYVNFMSNPDERTAVDQFGKGDKYIGVAVMMATLPGLPMFGHGQVEGFYERYGMEYRRAYYDESPDVELIGHHEREIAPLLRRRYLFSAVERFLLYDYFTTGGSVDENVFAYSNSSGDERALIVYHNRFGETRGWIRSSVAYSERQASGERTLVQRTLSEGLGLTPREDCFAIFRDRVTGLEYIRSSRDLAESGLYLELAAYGRHVFVDFREVQSTDRAPYGQLAELLGQAGVPSVEVELRRLALEPALQPFRHLLDPAFVRELIRSPGARSPSVADGRSRPVAHENEALLAEVESRAAAIVRAIVGLTRSDADPISLARAARAEVEAILTLSARDTSVAAQTTRARIAAGYWRVPPDDAVAIATLLAIALSRPFALAARGPGGASATWLDEWTLRDVISGSLIGVGLSYDQTQRATSLVGMLSSQELSALGVGPRRGYAELADLLDSEEGRMFARANWHNGVIWCHRESVIELRWWLGEEALLAVSLSDGPSGTARALVGWRAFALAVDRQMERSEYHLDVLVSLLRGSGSRGRLSESRAAVARPSGKGASNRL